MSTIITNTSVFTNREFPFQKIESSEVEKRDRKYYIDYTIDNIPVFFQINKVRLNSDPVFLDENQGYIELELKDRLQELQTFFGELDNFNQILCFKHSEEWLGKALDMGEIEKVYKSNLKNNLLRIKIEKDGLKVYDMKRNTLYLERDLKEGDTLDIIVEISGLKIMKSAFTTHMVLRQIRKHPEIQKVKKIIPNEYLFIDEYNKKKQIQDGSLDSQTDIDVIVNMKSTKPNKNQNQNAGDLSSQSNISIHKKSNTKKQKKDQIEDIEKMMKIMVPPKFSSKKASTSNELDLDISLSDLRDPKDMLEMSESKSSSNINMEKDDDDSKVEQKNLKKVENLMSNILENSSIASESESRRDKLLEQFEKGELSISLSGVNSIKIPTKKIEQARKKNNRLTNEELFKNI